MLKKTSIFMAVALCYSVVAGPTKRIASTPNGAAVRALAAEYINLEKEPVEGFKIKLLDDDNLFDWDIGIFGPPNTLYQGGYFKALMKFPDDYPYSPPSVRFMTDLFHPNIYDTGMLCISILHPPIDDPQSGETLNERWNPSQTIRTILLSVISLLNEPNISSPANVDAAVMYRKWKEGIDKEYENIVKRQVLATKAIAEEEGVVVPLTLDEYCIKPTKKPSIQYNSDDEDKEDFYDNFDHAYDLSDDELLGSDESVEDKYEPVDDKDIGDEYEYDD